MRNVSRQRHVVSSVQLRELRVDQLNLGLGNVEARGDSHVESPIGEVEVLLIGAHVLVGHGEQTARLEEVEVALLYVEQDRLPRRVGVCLQGALGRLSCLDPSEALAEVEEDLGERDARRVEGEGARGAADLRRGARRRAGMTALRAIAGIDLGERRGNDLPRLLVTDLRGRLGRLEVGVLLDGDGQALRKRLLRLVLGKRRRRHPARQQQSAERKSGRSHRTRLGGRRERRRGSAAKPRSKRSIAPPAS